MEGIGEYFKDVVREVREYHPDWYIEGVGVEEDHIHLQMVIPPRYSVSKVVEVLKSKTSKRIREKFPHFLKKIYWDGGGIWAQGFFVSSVGINEKVIQQYIRYNAFNVDTDALWIMPPAA